MGVVLAADVSGWVVDGSPVLMVGVGSKTRLVAAVGN